jgi:hypothetical protein
VLGGPAEIDMKQKEHPAATAAMGTDVGPGGARSAGWAIEADGDVKELMPIVSQWFNDFFNHLMCGTCTIQQRVFKIFFPHGSFFPSH